MSKRKHKTVPLIITVLVLAVIGFMLFPRKVGYKDGGTVAYQSFFFGMIYSIEDLHRLPSQIDADGYGYYTKGIVVKIFGIEVYDGSYTDYNDVAIAPHTSEIEEFSELNETIFDDADT